MILGILHPFVVHFAVALPLIGFGLDLVYQVRKGIPCIQCAMMVTLMGVFFLVLAYVSGHFAEEGAKVFAGAVARETLEAHEATGKIVLGLFLALGVLRLYLALHGNEWMRTLYLGAMAVAVALLLYQGKTGGVLVYEHGVGTQLLVPAFSKQ